jgi:hypothetical protein
MEAIEKTRQELDDQLQAEVAREPLRALAAIGAVGRDLAARQAEAVRAAVQAHTWGEIGAALGVTRQGAHQRFAKAWAQTLKDEIRQASRDYKSASSHGTPEAAAAARARMDALIAELARGSRRRS